MTIRLHDLTGASNGPSGRPSILSVGDSLIWGQGLRPEHRFREIVRQRLGEEVGSPAIELSMARSGARLHPMRNPGVAETDKDISDLLLDENTPRIEDHYSPTAFTRELIGQSPSTFQQIWDAHEILNDDPGGKPEEVRWILLDGGINDIGLDGILTPFPAYKDGYILSGWSAWLRDKGLEIEGEMVETLGRALKLFPNAVIVVNGYYPVFSRYSLGHATRLQSVGMLHATITSIGLLIPFGLDALASACETWRDVTNHVLRRAIAKVRRMQSKRTILFARSSIEGSHCLFAPNSWLWGYDSSPDDVPTTAGHWLQWLAAATPEDEVSRERIARCQALVPSGVSGVVCSLASIGHPNRAGARDYAQSIIEALEDAGIINSDLHECSLGRRRRQKACTTFSDEWGYGCVSVEAAIGENCDVMIRTFARSTKSLFNLAGRMLQNAGSSLGAAAQCFDNSAGRMAEAASNQFNQATDNFEAAASQFVEITTCWDQTAADIRACDDVEASEVAACRAAFNGRVNGPCNIQCNSFTNCNRFSRLNPRRYACRAARAVCVAAAAVAREGCIVGAAAIREACEAAAWAKSAACKAAVVLGNTVCSTRRVLTGSLEVLIGTGHSLLGVGAALGSFSNNAFCALGNAGRAFAITVGGAGLVIAGTGMAFATGFASLGCMTSRWIANRSCRLTGWAGDKACRIGATFVDGLCWLSLPFRALARRSFRAFASR